jgi:superfamily I DNA/RNA helicase
VLQVNCRNTVKIAHHCAELVSIEPSVRDGSPAGDNPEFRSATDLKAAFQAAGKKVREWCMSGQGGMKHRQVVVLAPSSDQHEWPKDFGTIPATQNFDKWSDNKGVLISTAKRFKGLEADAVVIIEKQSDEPKARSEQYVAHSRAKHLLTVIEIGK